MAKKNRKKRKKQKRHQTMMTRPGAGFGMPLPSIWLGTGGSLASIVGGTEHPMLGLALVVAGFLAACWEANR